MHLIHEYGLVAVAAIIGLECLGLPVPGETALLAAAIYAGTKTDLNINAGPGGTVSKQSMDENDILCFQGRLGAGELVEQRKGGASCGQRAHKGATVHRDSPLELGVFPVNDGSARRGLETTCLTQSGQSVSAAYDAAPGSEIVRVSRSVPLRGPEWRSPRSYLVGVSGGAR